MENTDKSIRLLNELIEINNDRIEGYGTASKETDETDLQTFFSELSATSREFVSELTQEVHRLGGVPPTGTTVSGKFFRVWMDVKAALTRHDRERILESCEFGEDAALTVYKDELAAANGNLTTDQRNMITRHYDRLKADHDRIRQMRDQLKTQG